MKNVAKREEKRNCLPGLLETVKTIVMLILVSVFSSCVFLVFLSEFLPLLLALFVVPLFFSFSFLWSSRFWSSSVSPLFPLFCILSPCMFLCIFFWFSVPLCFVFLLWKLSLVLGLFSFLWFCSSSPFFLFLFFSPPPPLPCLTLSGFLKPDNGHLLLMCSCLTIVRHEHLCFFEKKQGNNSPAFSGLFKVALGG